jgi:P27 family predicted phage terminase small subunit
MNKYIQIQEDVKDYLIARGVYDGVDDSLIVELVFNMELCDEARDDIRKRGIQVNIRKSADDEPYYQVNQSIGVYNGAYKAVTAISTKLGLTVLDRTKLGLKTAKKASALDRLLNDE